MSRKPKMTVKLLIQKAAYSVSNITFTRKLEMIDYLGYSKF